MQRSALLMLFYFLVVFGLAMLWRSWAVWRRTGVNPFMLSRKDDALGYVARGFKLVLLLIPLGLIATGWGTNAADWLAPFQTKLLPPASPAVWVSTAGWAILLLAAALLVKAQADMGASWRVGLDAGTAGDLVQTGCFAFSRNPIFLAMRLSLWGWLLVMPLWWVLLLALCGELLLQVHVRLEEAHLRNLYGAAYERYCATVSRWVGGFAGQK